jgi:hypothetical protein
VPAFLLGRVSKGVGVSECTSVSMSTCVTRNQRWAPALFSRFRAREREAKKKARKREEKRARKKAKAPSAKEKKREFALFPQPIVEIRFQSPKPLGRGKAKVLSEMYSSVC